MKVLSCSNIYKRYKTDKFELKIDQFDIQEGNTIALLGPNGSGKTTLLKLILDLISLDKGVIKILGESSTNKVARKDLAYLPEQVAYPSNFTAHQVLFYFSSINRNDFKRINDQIRKLAFVFRVDYLGKKIKNLSKGMVQTIGLLNTFLDSKKIYILDEPFNGLDAVQKENILGYMRKEMDNATFLITTHVTHDIESIYDEAVIIKDGSIIEKKSKKDVMRENSSLQDYYLTYFREREKEV